MADPTIPIAGAPGDTVSTEAPEEAPAAERVALTHRLELVAALLAGVVALEFVAFIIGVASGREGTTFGDRLEFVSLNLDAKMAVILLMAAMLATLRDVVSADFATPRSDLGRRTLMAVAALGVIIAVLSLIGVGLDISRTDLTAFGTNATASVLHRLAIVLMAAIAAGWSLAALGIRITTNRS
jgi:hypothetical protein